MKKIYLIILGLITFNLISQTSLIPNQEWLVNSAAIKFKIKNAGFNVDGTLSGFTAKIIFDPIKAYGNSIEATVDSKSINTGNNTRDGHLKKTEYFDVSAFPSITLKSNLFSKEVNGSYKGYFKLKLKGKTKDITIPFTFIEKEGKATFKGSFTINRLDYGVGTSSIIMADNINVSVEVNVIKK